MAGRVWSRIGQKGRFDGVVRVCAGVVLKAAEQPIDTGTAAGKAFLDMLDVFAEFGTNLRKERQAEGIAAAKARGVHEGGKPQIDVAAVRALLAQGVRPAHVARQLDISRGTV